MEHIGKCIGKTDANTKDAQEISRISSLQFLLLPCHFKIDISKSCTFSKQSGGRPWQKRFTSHVLPLKGVPMTSIEACQFGLNSKAPGTCLEGPA